MKLVFWQNIQQSRNPLVQQSSSKLVEPEVVATSPCPVKSRVPVCCGFDSWNWWAREDLHLQGSQTLDLRGLLFPLNHSPENGNWILQSVPPRQEFITKE